MAVDFWADRQGSLCLADLVGAYRTEWLREAGEYAGLRAVADFPAEFARCLVEREVSRIDVDFGRH
jgi:hypothetical protein